MNKPEQSPLNKATVYPDTYAPELLFPIARETNREKIGILGSIPFHGYDVWNAFELSWLNPKGRPCVAVGRFAVPCTSPCLIESKSLKLYLNSLNSEHFDSMQQVSDTIQADLSKAAEAQVEVDLHELAEFNQSALSILPGVSLDKLDVTITDFTPNPSHLTTQDRIVDETLFSDLLKSNCPVTDQPDWGSVIVSYRGHEIDHAGLLKYIVSLRNHQEFHEQCVERIFMDIMKHCKPEKLTVAAHYTRRGGLDINPLRSTETDLRAENRRLVRQ